MLDCARELRNMPIHFKPLLSRLVTAVILLQLAQPDLAAVPQKGAGALPSQAEIPSPPVPGQPNRADLDRAIARGTRSYIRDFVEPSYAAVSNGGYVDYKNADGDVKRYGPKAYVAYQLYLLTHFLMYYQDFGVDPESELFRKVRDWFVEEFDGRTGSWLWSHEGCLHAKGMIALANLGRSALVRKAYDWALRSPLSLPYLPPGSLPVSDRIFTIMQSGNIIQTLGNARNSLTGKHGWEHGSPVPDLENSAKLLYALLQAGFPSTHARLTDLRRGLANRLLALAPPMIAADYVGLAWYVFVIHDFHLEPDLAYQRCLQIDGDDPRRWMEDALRVDGVPGLPQPPGPRALMTAGRRSPQLDAAVNGYVASQSESGAWPLPRALSLWGLDKPPAAGIKLGTMDGANTYLLTLTLIHYRDRISSDDSEFAVPSLSLKHRPTAAAALDDSPGAMAVERACTGCHARPHPDSYSREDWPGVTRKMEEYMFEKGMNVAPRDLALVLESRKVPAGAEPTLVARSLPRETISTPDDLILQDPLIKIQGVSHANPMLLTRPRW